MGNLYWVLITVSVVFFITSLLKIKVKALRIILRIFAFYLCIFPAFHYLNYEIRDGTRSLIAGALVFAYIIVLLIRRSESLKDLFSSTFESLKDIAFGLLGVAVFIGVVLLFWSIPHYLGVKPAVVTEKKMYFINCSDAFSQGYSNIYENEYGYRSELDRDSDGVACER
ncbi:excalibur calcium-binding domain-containing protein [Paenibacillus lautus]|uniref:excalibur calcium-binding domain-containing protein n=1 Tax=Paenibacillus lautus TaxID=1401 RepID=UPI00203D5D9A|nr:excalibur calcium-binding domain-containing protein [Paenibacillus lautus]MCM3257082.1 excalibur calcium-binding domain-containing protein [Paenibacillus lautus]